MFRRSFAGSPRRWGLVASALFLCIFASAASSAPATSVSGKPSTPGNTALGGFIKDKALARLLGEMLFRDTVEVMADASTSPPVAAPAAATPDPTRDNSAVGQVARSVLAHQTLGRYLWLIRRAYDDSLWRGGDRERIERHFPLIWRTSILLYEATLNASPHRVRVCSPTDNSDEFDCRDEIERAKVVPIPAAAPLLELLHQPVIG